MLHHLPAIRPLAHSGEHAWIRRGVDNEICGGQSIDVGRATNVAVKELLAALLQRRAIPFAAGANQIINAENLQIGAVLRQRSSKDVADEAARSGKENLHSLGNSKRRA